MYFVIFIRFITAMSLCQHNVGKYNGLYVSIKLIFVMDVNYLHIIGLVKERGYFQASVGSKRDEPSH